MRTGGPTRTTQSPGTGQHTDVLVIGAGLSGIAIAHHLSVEAPDHRFLIVEAREAVGGTWDLFRYPGVRSDSDMATFGYAFRPWEGRRNFATGPELASYIEETAAAIGVLDDIQFGWRVVELDWSSTTCCWTARLVDRDGVTRSIESRFVYAATGYYSYAAGHVPNWPGRADYTGQVVHPQDWPQDLDCTGARVVVVGSGATAVSLVPALATTAASVTMVQRTPSDVVARPSADPATTGLAGSLPRKHALRWVRERNIRLSSLSYRFARAAPGLARRLIQRGRRQVLGPEHDASFSPPYDVWDQRVCAAPDGDLFEHIRDGRVSIVTDPVVAWTADGVKCRSGATLPADIVVTATGLRMKLFEGMGLSVDGEPVQLADTVTWRGLMLAGIPNLFLAVGYINSSWTLRCEMTAAWVGRTLARMQRDGSTVVVPDLPPSGVELEPIMPLRASYVRRAEAELPMATRQGPWRAVQDPVVERKMFGDWRRSKQGLRFHGAPKVAVITGAASGIGRELANGLARRGCRLMLVDMDAEGLAETVAGLPASTASMHVVDLTDSDAVATFAAQVAETTGHLDLLFNNAGVAMLGDFEELSDADVRWLFDVNLFGAMEMTRVLLPLLKQSPRARILNVSSLFGLIGPPGQTAYVASKFALRGFSGALRAELSSTSVGVTVAYPGGIATRIADNARVADGIESNRVADSLARSRKLLSLPPSVAAETMIEAVEQGRDNIIIGRDARLLAFVARYLPRLEAPFMRWATRLER